MECRDYGQGLAVSNMEIWGSLLWVIEVEHVIRWLCLWSVSLLGETGCTLSCFAPGQPPEAAQVYPREESHFSSVHPCPVSWGLCGQMLAGPDSAVIFVAYDTCGLWEPLSSWHPLEGI